MDPHIHDKLDELDYLMEEIHELRMHYHDLKDEKELLTHDLQNIKTAKNTRAVKLYVNYFDSK